MDCSYGSYCDSDNASSGCRCGSDSDSFNSRTPSDPNHSPLYQRQRPTESLTTRIANFKQTFLPQLRIMLGEDRFSRFQAENARLAASGLERRALKMGDVAPDILLPSYDGRMWSLSHKLRSHHVIVHFYRGAWCPYCNLVLQSHSEFLDEYDDYNAAFVAVTPQLASVVSTSVSQLDNQFPFPILTDTHLEVIPAYHLLFQLSDELRDIHLHGMSVALSTYYGNDKGNLPIPATYIIERTTGRIVWAHVEYDFTVRADPLDIIEQLQKLMAREESAAVSDLEGLSLGG